MSGHSPPMNRRASIGATVAEMVEAFGSGVGARPWMLKMIRRDRALIRALANVEARRELPRSAVRPA